MLFFVSTTATGEGPSSPEAEIRALMQANAENDLTTMASLMSQDSDAIGYPIGGRKYVGWAPFAREMEEEFASVQKLKIPITNLKVWERGETAWFAMELDYIRYVATTSGMEGTVIPLRETGVLERRNGQWILVAWHESSQRSSLGTAVSAQGASVASRNVHGVAAGSGLKTLSGQWGIEEEDKTYKATFDRKGNRIYSHKGGTFRITSTDNKLVQGTWHQSGNDREGGFEVLLSEDETEAKGIWWYTRVGTRNNIPPREHGGTYFWKRQSPASSVDQKP